MQDLKTGHLLGAAPKAQFWGQVIGATAGAIFSSFIYRLYTTYVHPLPLQDLTDLAACMRSPASSSKFRLPTCGSSLPGLSRAKASRTWLPSGHSELDSSSYSSPCSGRFQLESHGDPGFLEVLQSPLACTTYRLSHWHAPSVASVAGYGCTG